MRKYFLTGLAILLPIILTLLIAKFFLGFLTKPFLGITQQLLTLFSGADGVLKNSPGLLKFLSQFLTLLFLFGFIVFIGLIAKQFIAAVFFTQADRFLHSIPIANKIYKAAQEVIQSLFSPTKPSFSKVVLVAFPHSKSKVLGFITREDFPVHGSTSHSDYVSVFVPGAPNPTIGFMIMLSRSKLIATDLKVEDALKFIVSCGVILEKKEELHESGTKAFDHISQSLG